MEAENISEELWQTFSHLKTYDEAAKEHLAAGLPIYYSEEDTPLDAAIKEYPDGRRELVRYDFAGNQIISVL